MSVYLISVLKTAAITLVMSRGVKILGKKEMAEVISFCGWMMVGVEVLEWINAIKNNPPEIIEKTENIFDKGRKFFEFLDKVKLPDFIDKPGTGASGKW